MFDRAETPSGDGLFIANPDGSGLERLATGWGGGWSPDGSQIAYASDAPGFALGVIGVDGQAGLQIAGGTPRDWEWSPDGHLIAYCLEDDRTVYLLDPHDGTVTKPAQAAGAVDWIDWSPDGSEMAIESGSDVDLVAVATGALRVLAVGASEPVWSPDGARIAFTSGPDASRLEAINADGTDRRLISSHNTCRAFGTPFDWAADGDTLVFEKPRSAGAGCDLWRADLTDRTQTAITHAFPSGGDFTDPYWAPTTVVAHPEARRFVAPEPTQSVQTKATISDLAADGTHAAVVSGAGNGSVSVWTRGGGLRKLGGSGVDYARLQLVVAGDRVAWTEDNGGGVPTYYLAVTDDAGNLSYRDSAYLAHDELGDVAGDGPLLVYATWHYNDSSGGTKLWRIDGKRRQLLRSWSDIVDVVAVDAGRIAVLRRTGELLLLDRSGRRLSGFRLPEDADAYRLDGQKLLVLHGSTLDVRSTTDGKLERRRRLAGADGPLALGGAEGDVVAYTEGIAIHLLRLSTGTDVVLHIPGEEDPAGAVLTPAGLYYAYNQAESGQHGRVGFMPEKTVSRLLAPTTS